MSRKQSLPVWRAYEMRDHLTLPAPEEKALYRICRDGEDASPLTEVMTLEVHRALIRLLLREKEGQNCT